MSDSVNLGSLLSDPNFAALVAGAAAQNIQQQTAQETTMQVTSNLPTNILNHLQANGMNATDVAEIEKRVDKPGRLPAKYSALIKEVRKMLKAQQPAQNAVSTPSQVSTEQLNASLNEAAPPAKAPAEAPAEVEEVWETTPIAAYQLGASTQLRVNRSSTGRVGFRVFFVRRGEENYNPTKKGFTLAPNQLEHLKSVL